MTVPVQKDSSQEGWGDVSRVRRYPPVWQSVGGGDRPVRLGAHTTFLLTNLTKAQFINCVQTCY